MRKPLLAAATSLVLLAAAAYAAIAQDALTGVFAPFVVDVQQAVPVEVSVAVPVEGGETVTATVPMTVNVSLRVSVEGPDVVTVETLGETEPEIEVSEARSTPELPGHVRLAWTGSEVQTLEGLQVEVQRVTLMDAEAAREADPKLAEMLDRNAFAGATTVGAISVVITNTTESKMAAFLTRGEVVVGTTQISLGDFESYARGDITGEIYPGVVKRGTIVFASSDLNVADFPDGIDVYFNGDKPHDGDYYAIGDEEYELEVRLTPLEP